MSGERSNRLVGIAARAAQRTANRLQVVDSLFAPEGPESLVRELQWEAYLEHWADSGHRAAEDPNCTHPVCLTAFAMINVAMAQLQQQQMQQQQAQQPQGQPGMP
jgi:hypothetical protein